MIWYADTGRKWGDVFFLEFADGVEKRQGCDLLRLVRSESQEGTLPRLGQRDRGIMAERDLRAVLALDDNPLFRFFPDAECRRGQTGVEVQALGK